MEKEIKYLDFGERYIELDMPMLRPDVSIKRTCIFLLISEVALLAVSFGVALILKMLLEFELPFAVTIVLLNLVFAAVAILVFFDKFIIKAVLLYQRYASYSVRERCTMIPSCSEYMILAVKKYGAVKGLFKGIGRLRRCGKACEHIEDWP